MMMLLQIMAFFFLPVTGTEKGVAPASARHPFYVSVTEVTQNTTDKSLEVSCKIFADDFEETLRLAYKTKLDINAAHEKATFDKLIPDYITKHLALVADGQPLKLSYVGYEKEKESVYCYFEVPGVGAVKNLQARNTLLHDFKNEQINIMHVTMNGERKSTKLDYPVSQAKFNFN